MMRVAVSFIDRVRRRSRVGVVPSLATFAFVFVVLIARAWERLAKPDFWAEDGAVFLSQALTGGMRSLLEPMAGSYFTIERLIMLAAVKVTPLAWAPFVVCITCIGLTAWIASRIALDDYAWLLPSLTLRIAAAGLFCLLPGLYEMLGNLCNVNWILFSWVALIGLTDPRRALTVREIVITGLVTVSIGTSILLAPLFLWRASVAASYGRRPIGEPIVLGTIGLLGVVLPAAFGGPHPATPAEVTPFALVGVWYDHVARLVAFTPWIGDRLTSRIGGSPPAGIYRVGEVAFLLFLTAWAWSCRRDRRVQAGMALLFGVSVWTVLSVVARTYAYDLFQRQRGEWFYQSRYSFIMSFTAVILWLIILQSITRSRVQRAAAFIVFLALNVTLSLHRFTIDAYSHPRFIVRASGATVTVKPVPADAAPARQTYWRTIAPELERARTTGCPKTVVVLQYPDPWAFTYQSPGPDKRCD